MLCLVVQTSPGASQAQTTNITSTTDAGNLGTTVTNTGNLYDITGGTRPGNGPNLFHSFGDFSVGPGDIANFLNDSGLPTSNILGRVTGGNTSHIDGAIQTAGFGNANLFLINPAGTVFGPHGSVNVGGSVSFSTAQYLRLFDGVNSGNFYANPANDSLANSVLAVAPVVDFGFLSPDAYGFLTPPDPSATITVQGSALSVPSGQSISLVGGKVVIQAATPPDGTVQPAQLSAPNGSILLASTASPGEFDAATLQPLPNVDWVSFTSSGSVFLAPGSNIDVSGPSTVFIIGGQLVVSVNDATLSTSESPSPPDTILLTPGSSIVTSNSGTDPGADVQLIASNVQMDGVFMQSTTMGDSSGGNIMADVGTLALTNGAAIITHTFGPGLGGDVHLTASTIVLTEASTIQTQTFGPGRGGEVHVTAGNLTLENQSIIFTGTQARDGMGGDLSLNVGTLRLFGASLMQSGNFNFGTDLDGDGKPDVFGVGGNVTIQGIQGAGSAADSMLLAGGSAVVSQTSVSNAAGRISITANTLDLVDEASTIISTTFGAAGGGDIVLSVQEARLLGGATITSQTDFTDQVAAPAGRVTVQGLQGAGSKADSFTLAGQDSGIFSVSFGTANPGGIEMHAKTVSLMDGALIQSGDPILTSGTPEGVIIDADSVGISGGSRISSQAFNASAGRVFITADALTLDNGFIVTNTRSEGRGGDVVLNGRIVSLTNGATIDSSTIDTGRAGDITITTHTLDLDNGADIAANTSGAAPAGDITLNVDTLTLGYPGILLPGGFGGSTISSSSTFFTNSTGGDAGTITIQGVTGAGSPASHMRLDGGQIRTEIWGGSAANTAAAITITAHTLALASGFIGADTYGAAPAGDITLNVGTLMVGGSNINSSSVDFNPTAGNAGSITIQGVAGSGSSATEVSLEGATINTGINGGNAASTPGTITITAQTLTLPNEARIVADTYGGAPAGNIVLNVGTLMANSRTANSPAGDSTISSRSVFSTAGDAGSITIQGITGAGSPAANVRLDRTTISTEINGGNAASTPGTITITAQTLTLAHDAHIDAQTVGDAPAGDIVLNVDTLTAANSTFSTSSSSTDLTAGNAGSITIQGVTGAGSPAAHVSLDGSGISTEISTGSAASTRASIDITAQTLDLDNRTQIRANTSGEASAGDIVLIIQALTMTLDSAISGNARTGGTGKAGAITITGAGAAPTTITGGTIQAQSETSASAGDITLQAPGDLTLLGTTVSVKNTGTGDAGSINFRAGNDLLVRNSQVSTESAEASGGNIKLTAPNLIHLVDSTLTSSVQGQAGSNGGNINIDPQWVVIQNSQLLANANAGAGGSITIAASGAVLIDPNSLLSASAGPAGVSGSVNIIAPLQVLGGILVPLNQSFSQANLSGDRCAADPTGQFSSFVQVGRDGVPQVPGALSPSPLSFVETLTSRSLGSPRPNWAATRLGLDSTSDPALFRFHSACRS